MFCGVKQGLTVGVYFVNLASSATITMDETSRSLANLPPPFSRQTALKSSEKERRARRSVAEENVDQCGCYCLLSRSSAQLCGRVEAAAAPGELASGLHKYSSRRKWSGFLAPACRGPTEESGSVGERGRGCGQDVGGGRVRKAPGRQR